MLINFNFTNFKSFKERIEFDMNAGKSRRKDPCEGNVAEVSPNGYKNRLAMLQSSVIYGANASGKSNFVKALFVMMKIVMASNNALNRYIVPFKLNSKSVEEPCRFEVTILADDNVIYEYGFSATTEAIHEEWLNSYPNGRIKKLFKRTLVSTRKTQKKGKKEKKYEYSYIINKLAGDRKVWERATSPQRLFLSTAIQLNNKELSPVRDWFKDKLCFLGTLDIMNSLHSVNHCQDGYKEEIIRFLKGIDIAIEDIVIEEGDVPKELLEFFEKIKDDDDELPTQSIEVFTLHKSQDKDNVKFDMNEESRGTQKMFAFAYPILNALRNGQVLFVDELDNSLHSRLVKFIVELFHSTRNNRHNAQLIFTTHDTTLLNEELFRHDQVWFCEKNHKTQESELYSLMDFKPRKDIKNFERAYLHGRFGATPVVADPSIELLIKN